MGVVSVHTGRPRRKTMGVIRSASMNATRRNIFESVGTRGLNAMKKMLLAKRARILVRDVPLGYAARVTAAMKQQ